MSDSNTKTYVLDTSVLLSDPQAIQKFKGNTVVVPMTVVVELEKKRNDQELGYFARSALRALEELREAADASLLRGIALGDTGGRLEVSTHAVTDLLPSVVDTRSNDAKILATALTMDKERGHVVLVSQDLPMRLLASSLGLQVEHYRAEDRKHQDWKGYAHEAVPEEVIEALFVDDKVNYADGVEHPVNSGVVLTSETSSALAVYVGEGNYVNVTDVDEVFEVKARSAEQRFAISHLIRDDVGIVSIGGKAGTGKSAMALLAGIHAVLEDKKYSKIVVFRPLYAVGGQDLGFLPGDHTEKMNPWAQAVFDTLEPLVSKNVIDELISRGLIEVLPLTHIRGRSLHDSYVIVDEAQSLERNVLLTVLSRMGQNSKIVLTHDVAQRDNLHVGRWDGILSVVEALKGSELFAHVTLRKSERSKIAELVTNLLDF